MKNWKRRIPFAFVQIPNSFIDTWMPVITAGAAMAYVAIARATWGFNKQSDVLATTELARRCGMPLRSTERALSELRRHGLLKCEGPDRHAKTMTLQISRLTQIPGTAIQAARDDKVLPFLAARYRPNGGPQ